MRLPATPLPSGHPLLKDVLWYAAAAGAVVGLSATEADAQIVYTDVDPDLVVQDTFEGSTFTGPAIDLLDDGDAEIAFGERIDGLYTLGLLDVTSDGPATVTAVVGTIVPFGGNPYAYFLPLSAGASIGPENATLGGYTFATFTFNNSDPAGWLGTDAFIGIQFVTPAGTTHYGWLRASMPIDGGAVTIHEYAFEATPDTPIEAGATGVAIEPGPDGQPGTHALTAVSPNPFSGRAAFAVEVAETQTVRVEVYNALGQRVGTLHDGALAAGSAHRFTLDGGDLAAGVYVVRVTGERFTDTRTVTLAR